MIDFDADSHTYWRDGERIPAVSDILAVALPDPYAFVDERTMEIARNRGIAVDAAIQQLLTGTGVLNVGIEVLPYLRSYEAWINATGWRSITTQPQLYDAELDVAGTADEVGILNGLVTILDWKCTSQLQDKHRYQLGGYARMWDQLHPHWQIKQARVLLLQGDGRIAKAHPIDVAMYRSQFVRIVKGYRARTAEPAPMGE